MLALEPFEKDGKPQLDIVSVSEMLKEVASALKELDATSYAEFDPELIVQDGAVSGVF